MLKIGNLELGNKICITAILDEFIPSEEVTEYKKEGVDILEMRIDCYDKPLHKVVHYLEEIRDKVSLPMIGTVRETKENRLMRTDIFRRIIPFVDCVDIELGSPISDTVMSVANGKTVIVSEHDFKKTPSKTGLEDIVDRSLKQGADIVKIATMANSRNDVRRLLKFTEECGCPLVTIAMGSIGTVSRVIAPLFNSLFTYGYITKPVAPGQLSVKKLLEERQLFFS